MRKNTVAYQVRTQIISWGKDKRFTLKDLHHLGNVSTVNSAVYKMLADKILIPVGKIHNPRGCDFGVFMATTQLLNGEPVKEHESTFMLGESCKRILPTWFGFPV
jgi:hypothetical protein